MCDIFHFQTIFAISLFQVLIIKWDSQFLRNVNFSPLTGCIEGHPVQWERGQLVLRLLYDGLSRQVYERKPQFFCKALSL